MSDDAESPGCTLLIGAIIIACCIGHFYGDVAYGWFAIGVFVLLIGIIEVIVAILK